MILGVTETWKWVNGHTSQADPNNLTHKDSRPQGIREDYYYFISHPCRYYFEKGIVSYPNVSSPFMLAVCDRFLDMEHTASTRNVPKVTTTVWAGSTKEEEDVLVTCGRRNTSFHIESSSGKWNKPQELRLTCGCITMNKGYDCNNF